MNIKLDLKDEKYCNGCPCLEYISQTKQKFCKYLEKFLVVENDNIIRVCQNEDRKA